MPISQSLKKSVKKFCNILENRSVLFLGTWSHSTSSDPFEVKGGHVTGISQRKTSGSDLSHLQVGALRAISSSLA